MAGKPGEDRMSRSEAARAGVRGSASRPGGGSGGSQLLGTKNPASGLSDKDILSGVGWGSNQDPNGPTAERYARNGAFGPSGPNERWGVTPGTPPDIQKQQDNYNAAWNDRLNRGFGGWLRDKLLDVVPGFRQEDPNWNDPATFAKGIYHDSWSPWGAAASLASMASPIPGTSTIAGLAANEIADAAGAERYVFGGGGWAPSVGAPEPGTGPKAQAKEDAISGNQTPTGGKGTASGASLLPAIVGNPSLAFAPSQIPAPSSGATLPPVAQPQAYPGAYMPVAGPSPYGWQRPAWMV